jgi:hypothetical protein
LQYEYDSENGSSEGEDLIGEDTPSDDADTNDTPSEHPTEDLTASTSALDHSTPPSPSPITPQPSERDQLFPATLRARHASGSLLSTDTGTTTGTSNPKSADISTTAEKLLTHHRTEQEALTEDLVSMAAALKASSLSFAQSLDAEDEILKRATDGLDRNTSGLDAAQKRMGYLRKMTEGRGWWGRMMMYAWIFGLAVTAVVIVGVLPKLRF